MLPSFALSKLDAIRNRRNGGPPLRLGTTSAPGKKRESVQVEECHVGTTARPTRKHDHWNPVWLKRSVLLTVAAFSLSLSASILLLLLVSQKEHGLPLPSDNHYIWTYGPTLIFILFVALWRQIEYHCKVLTPWSVLQNIEREARENVLLDYISPIQLSSLISAIRNKHSAVVIAGVGFLVVKLLALASTSLFSPRTITLAGTSINATRSAFRSTVRNDSAPTPGLFEPASVYEAYAVSVKGLPYREGLTKDLLHESVELPRGLRSQNGTFTGTVRALVPKFECQSAPFDLDFTQTNSTELHPEVQIKLGFPECTLRANGKGVSAVALNPQTFATPPRQLSPLVQRIDCDQQNPNATENWQLLTLVDFRYNQTITDGTDAVELGDPTQATSFSTKAVQGVGIACRSGYNLENVSVTYSLVDGQGSGNTTIRRASSQKDRKLDNLLDSDIGDLSTAALSAAATMFGSFLTQTYEEEYPNTLFKIMASLGGGTYASLLNESLMIQTAQTALQQIALQTLDKHTLADVKQPIQVDVAYDERRLIVNIISAATMIAGSSVLAVCAVCLAFIRPHNVTAQDPDHLSAAAITLKHSPVLQRMLEQASAQQQKLKYALQCAKFHVSKGREDETNDQGIQVHNKLATPFLGFPDGNSEAAPRQTRWFSEATTRRAFLLITIALPIAIIAALEALQQVSDSRHGLATIANPDDQFISLLPNILSAGAMLGIATMFNTVEFNISMLAPLRYLRSKVRDPRGDLMTCYLGRIPPMIVLTAFLRQHWSVMLSTSAALVGSVLTIIVSGLYTFETQGFRTPISLNRLDRFDITWAGSAFNDSAAAVVSSLTESTGLADPVFTYQELAFPRLQPVSLQTRNASQPPLLQIRLPALRASLDCVVLDSTTFNFTASSNPRLGSSSATFSSTMPLPSNCQRGGSAGNESNIEFRASFSLRSNTSYVGKLLDLHVGPYDDVLAEAFDELAPHTQPDNPPECPSLAFIYGYADVNDPSRTVAGAMVCTQRLEQLSAALTFTPANMSISLLYPPVPDEDSAAPVPNAPTNNNNLDGPTYVPYRIQQHFDKTFISNDHFRTPGRTCSFWDSMPNDDALEGNDPPIDPFWQGVLCAAEPTLPAELLADGDDEARSRIYTSVQAFYRRYMAKAIDANMRRPLDFNTDSPQREEEKSEVEAMLLNSEQIVRLVQSSTPKIVLQVMLGSMSALMGVAVWMCRLWEPMVQHNPCSIAGKMVLFAGSSMCDPANGGSGEDGAVLPDDVEKMDEEELRRLWRGRMFRLGWWEGEGGKRRWGIDVVGQG